jgi:iron complex transport system ATP-binding protein
VSSAEPGIRVLDAVDLSVRLGEALVVDRAHLSLRRGELVALVGPNGAGKTTLVRALAGLVPAEGKILLDGKPAEELSRRERARLIAYLPQGHVFHWPMAVDATVALGRHPHADPFSPPTDADRAAIARALAATNIEMLAARSVATLSGGERARVALARALATEAALLLADEPTVSLDPRHQLLVMDLLRQAARNGGSVLAVVHDLALAERFADRVIVMNRGSLVADGPPAQALSAERIAEVFGVVTLSVNTSEGSIILPWRAL